jgi:hypothetical protein
MKQVIKLTSLLPVLFLLSCDRDETGFFNGDAERVLIKQVLFNSESYYEYNYNAAYQILEEKSKWHYTRHNYLDNRLVSSDHYVDPGIFSSSWHAADSAMNREEWVNPGNTEKYSTMIYFLDDRNKLIKSSNYLGYSIYSYDGNGRICRQTFYHDREESGYTDFLYDRKGNLVKRLYYIVLESGDPELQTTTEYKFDDKHNPYLAFSSLMMPGIHTNVNNIVKETYTLHFEFGQDINRVQITENVYEYDDRGYPVRKNGTFEYRYY